MRELERLQEWYASMCNGDWEHTYGISITNIDNPGWAVEIELLDTYLFDVQFQTVARQGNDNDDWVRCDVVAGVFKGYGGPMNLAEILSIFLEWADLQWEK